MPYLKTYCGDNNLLMVEPWVEKIVQARQILDFRQV